MTIPNIFFKNSLFCSFPKISRPVLGEQLALDHMMSSHVSRDTCIKFHNREEFLESKHFLSSNSSYMGKRKTKVKVEEGGADGYSMYSEKDWNEAGKFLLINN